MAWFGYQNDGSTSITIPGGTNNELSIPVQAPTVNFLPGRQRFAFSVPFSNQESAGTPEAPTVTPAVSELPKRHHCVLRYRIPA